MGQFSAKISPNTGSLLSGNQHMQVFRILNEAFPNGFGHTNFLRVKSVDDLAAVWLRRVRLGLHRASVHNREKFEAVSDEVEAILQTSDDLEEAPEAPGPGA